MKKGIDAALFDNTIGDVSVLFVRDRYSDGTAYTTKRIIAVMLQAEQVINLFELI